MTNAINESKIIVTKIRLFATFKQITNHREIEYEIEDGTTVRQLLEALFDQYNALRDKIFNENNELRPWIHILKNGRNIKFLGGIETTLTDGDVVSLFPPVAGG
ncbi:MAG: MoaD/ThiS family protein [Candidatus Heimdallarchaeota archaeon]|nr:MAG: MoaD/ThiS family protein [Candidatus Heimdallarchaeota archaeon]